MKIKKYKKKTIGNYISREIIITVISIIVSILVINLFYRNFNKVIVPLAEMETRKYLTEIINNSTREIEFNKDLFTIDRNNNNEITMVNYNSYEATKLINEITDNIQNDFNKIDGGMVIMSIPLGIIFKNDLIKNFGPKIKVKVDIMGNVLSELETEVKPYGINNALVEVRVKLVANARCVLPFVSKDITVNNVIPLSINIVSGSIPEAYIAGFK